MLTTIKSASVVGTRGHPVDVEVHISEGLPGFTVVGKPDNECREFRDRVRAAVLSSGYRWPMNRITINIAGGQNTSTRGLDLPAAVGILASSEQVDLGRSPGRSVGLVGELGLDGSVRRVPAALPLVEALDTDDVVVPAADTAVAASVAGERTKPVQTLREVTEALSGEAPWPLSPPQAQRRAQSGPGRDLSEVRCPEHALRAMEIAAAGGHSLIFIGAPGCGKMAMSLRLESILPDLTPEESLESSRVHSAAGLPLDDGLLTRPPLRAPHHSASMAAMLGGGTLHARPGEISCAHNGVLYLDELAEFPASVLDALSQQPMREGKISIARANGLAVYPAHFQLVASMDRCPCGADDPAACVCSPEAVARYTRRLSGPLADHIDMTVQLRRADSKDGVTVTSAEVAERVAAARELARSRGARCNSDLSAQQIAEHDRLDDASREMLMDALQEGHLSARGLQSVRTVARTIRDLEGGGDIRPEDIAEALELRAPSWPSAQRDAGGFDGDALRSAVTDRSATACLATTADGGQCQHMVRASETCAAGHRRKR